MSAPWLQVPMPGGRILTVTHGRVRGKESWRHTLQLSIRPPVDQRHGGQILGYAHYYQVDTGDDRAATARVLLELAMGLAGLSDAVIEGRGA